MSDRRARVHGFRGYKCNNYRWHVFLSTKGRRNGILAFDTWDEAMTAANLLTGLEHLGDEA